MEEVEEEEGLIRIGTYPAPAISPGLELLCH